jgi:hypothetical protein
LAQVFKGLGGNSSSLGHYEKAVHNVDLWHAHRKSSLEEPIPPILHKSIIINGLWIISEILHVSFSTPYTGVSDLYVYFFEKALELLKENGLFGFIVSSKFLRADYGKKLTQYLQQNFTVLELIDFGDLQIFEGATTCPCIITIQKKKPAAVQ